MPVQMRSVHFPVALLMRVRYWGANILRTIEPDMSQKACEKLIHDKYVVKRWISKEPGWELEMQKKYPLNMDELAVLEYLNKKPCEITSTAAPPIRSANPKK